MIEKAKLLIIKNWKRLMAIGYFFFCSEAAEYDFWIMLKGWIKEKHQL